jgi:transposase
VGARLGNLPMSLIQEISQFLNKTEGLIFTKKIENSILICDFSKKRAAKDKSDREKQIRRAEKLLSTPSQILKKSKCIKNNSKNKTLELNTELISKTELLEGLKGYITNVADTPAESLIARYKDLWKIEKAFRIAKHDLEIRPIYLWSQIGIKSHLVIVFISLCIAKFLELKTDISLAVLNKMLWKICDVELVDTISLSSVRKRSQIPEFLKALENKLVTLK